MITFLIYDSNAAIEITSCHKFPHVRGDNRYMFNVTPERVEEFRELVLKKDVHCLELGYEHRI